MAATPRKRQITFGLLLAAGLLVTLAMILLPHRRATVDQVLGGGQQGQSGQPKVERASRTHPQVDVVFALDTTGSMSGLIAGAKRKIWAIANQLASGEPKPDVRIGLVGYRDLGDAYVTKRFPLSENIDEVYENLSGFKAEGGGDTPEHVNLALADSIRRMQWREGKNVLKLVFLVGDAPPHEGREGLYSADLAREASRQGITINTVRCGDATDTEASWRTIASLSGGEYTSAAQDGNMVAVRTEYDDRMAALNARLSHTLIPVGSAADRDMAARRAENNARMGGWAQAESAKYRTRSGKLDSVDIATVMAKGRKVEEMKDEELPPALAGLGKSARKAKVEKVLGERAALQAEIAKLSAARDKSIAAKAPTGPSVDSLVAGTLKKQGKRAGIAY
jgi:hypothetical protein